MVYPGTEARIVRPDGTDADWGEPGELWARGETVTLGYYRNPRATKDVYVDGWVRTGDTMKAEKPGLLL